MVHRATIDDILNMGPCWDADVVADAFGDRKTVSAEEILLARDIVPDMDAIWLVMQDPFTTQDQRNRFMFKIYGTSPPYGRGRYVDVSSAVNLGLVTTAEARTLLLKILTETT